MYERLKQNSRIDVIPGENGLHLERLTLDNAIETYGLIKISRDHLNQHGERTGAKYPDFWSFVSRIDPDAERQRFCVVQHVDDENHITAGGGGRERVVGFIAWEPKAEPGVVEIGYWIGQPYTGHGFAAKATQAATKFIFEDPSINKIIGEVKTGGIETDEHGSQQYVNGNSASAKSLVKSGFRLASIDSANQKATYELTREMLENPGHKSEPVKVR